LFQLSNKYHSTYQWSFAGKTGANGGDNPEGNGNAKQLLTDSLPPIFTDGSTNSGCEL